MPGDNKGDDFGEEENRERREVNEVLVRSDRAKVTECVMSVVEING